MSRRKVWGLLGWMGIAAAYRGWFSFQRSLTGIHKADGLIGVGLGLFICSRAAANLLDMLFDAHSGRLRAPSLSSSLVWAAFNLLVIFSGWFVMVFALTRFFR